MILAALLALLAADRYHSPRGPLFPSLCGLVASADGFPNVRSQWLEPEVLRDCALQWTRSNQLIAQATNYAWRPSLVRGPEGKEVCSARESGWNA